MELQKSHPAEDEIVNQYLVPALCKAAAVLGMVRHTTVSPYTHFTYKSSTVLWPNKLSNGYIWLVAAAKWRAYKMFAWRPRLWPRPQMFFFFYMCAYKPVCVCVQDKATSEPVCRVLELTLRSTHLPSRMGALHGLLYVLECDLLDDTVKQLIPAVSEYILSNLRAIAQ